MLLRTQRIGAAKPRSLQRGPKLRIKPWGFPSLNLVRERPSLTSTHSPLFCMKLNRSSRNSFLLGSASSSYSWGKTGHFPALYPPPPTHTGTPFNSNPWIKDPS